MESWPEKAPKFDIRAPQRLKISACLAHPWHWTLVLLVGDVVALSGAWKFAAFLNKFHSPMPPQLDWFTWFGLPGLFWAFAAVTLLVFAAHGLYHPQRQWKNYVRAAQLISLVYLLSLVLSYFYDPKLDAPRSLFFTAWFSSMALVIGWRLVATVLLNVLVRHQPPVSVFIIAPAERLNRLHDTLRQRSRYRIVGGAIATTAGSHATLQAILQSGAKEVLAAQLPATELASSLYWQLRRHGITLRLVPSSVETLHRRGVPEVVAGLPTLRMAAPWLGGWDYRFKRVVDVVGALVGLVMLAPLFLGVAITIKLTDPGPVFFRQERMGLHGKVFRMWKFRTMVVNAAALQAKLEAEHGTADQVLFKLKRDPRITSIGHFLRRTSIDELPQLFNVLVGQMSLVGPRPLPLRDIERFAPWHHTRHQVLPGITGLWQISGRSELDEFDDAARLDLYYIDNWSLNLDLEILLETVRIVLFRQGAY